MLAGVCICNIRSSDDNLSIDELLVEFGVGTIFVRGGYKGMALLLQPLPQSQLILAGSEQARLVLRMSSSLEFIILEMNSLHLSGTMMRAKTASVTWEISLHRTKPTTLCPEV